MPAAAALGLAPAAAARPDSRALALVAPGGAAVLAAASAALVLLRGALRDPPTTPGLMIVARPTGAAYLLLNAVMLV